MINSQLVGLLLRCARSISKGMVINSQLEWAALTRGGSISKGMGDQFLATSGLRHSPHQYIKGGG